MANAQRRSGHRSRRSVRTRLFTATAVAAVTSSLAVLCLVAAPATAIPPFPIRDDTTGPAGEVNTNWAQERIGNTVGNTFTSDGWLRLTNAGANQATNILNDTAFPSSTGFRVSFDYRQAGGTTFSNRTGDGMSFYLVDGGQSVASGGTGAGLGYANNAAGVVGTPGRCGVAAGYLGVGLDVFGSYSAGNQGNFPNSGAIAPSRVALRGSGDGCPPGTGGQGAREQDYPLAASVPVANVWTGTAGSTTDPATIMSLYRRVEVTVVPGTGEQVQVTVRMSALQQKNQPPGPLTEVLSTDLDQLPGQVPLPASLKLGFGASTGGATDFHDIRDILVTALSDAGLTKTVSPAPSHPGTPAGTFVPGDPITFTLTATNHGPTAVGDPPNGVARIADELSGLPLTGVSWACTGSGGGTCLTSNGSGPTIAADWHAPVGGSVTVTVTATVAPTAAGTYGSTAAIPTDFTTNTVDPDESGIQLDGGLSDTDLSNNTATAPFAVAGPHFTQAKSADGSIFVVGQPIVYTVTVTNDGTGPGTATLNDPVPATISVTDATCVGTGGATCTASTTGNTVTGTVDAPPGGAATYTINGMVIGAGSLQNTATVAPTTPGCGPECGGGTASSPPLTAGTASIALAKSATVGGQPTTTLVAGQGIEFDFAVTNTSSVPLENISIVEGTFTGSGTLSPPTCPPGALAPGAGATCTATYTVTQADVDAGTVQNTATALGTPVGSATPAESSPSTVTLTAVADPSMSLTKTATENGAQVTDITVGDTLHYTFTITNTGNVTLHDLDIDELEFTGSGSMSAIQCPTAPLAPQAAVSCTATYVVTQGDVDRGAIDNTARATGSDPNDTAVESNQAAAHAPSVAGPALELVKSATPSTATQAGQRITFVYDIINIGNVTLTSVGITEVSFTGSGALTPVVCPTDTIAPNESLLCQADYAMTQADLDAGGVDNTATAHGTDPSGTDVTSGPSTATVQIGEQAALALAKTADPTTVSAAGDVISYAFVVTNTGNVTVTASGVRETEFSGTPSPTVTCPPAAASLAPTASVTCVASYTTAQDDIDAGEITNTAVAHGVTTLGTEVESATATATVTVEQSPALTLEKTADPTTLTGAGGTITYTFHVSNTGNVTVTTPLILETAFSGTGELPDPVCPDTALAPSEALVCTVDYTVTDADVTARTLINTAQASATDPDATEVLSDPSTATVSLLAVPVPPPAHPTEPSAPELSDTGSRIPPLLWVAGALLIATGAVLLTVRGIRRRAERMRN